MGREESPTHDQVEAFQLARPNRSEKEESLIRANTKRKGQSFEIINDAINKSVKRFSFVSFAIILKNKRLTTTTLTKVLQSTIKFAVARLA